MARSLAIHAFLPLAMSNSDRLQLVETGSPQPEP